MRLTFSKRDYEEDPPRRSPLSRLLVGALLVLIVGYALVLRWPAINPEALWLDDAWVGMACRAKTWSDFLVTTTCSPVAYSLLNLLMCRVIPDPEVALQFVPLASSLLLCPLLYLIVSRLSGSYLMGLVAAAVISVSPQALIYSVRAKQYLLDSLLVSLLAAVFLWLSRSHSWRRFALGCLSGAISALFSYATLLFSAPFLHLRALWLAFTARDGGSQGVGRATLWRSLLSLALYDLFVGLFYLFILRRQNSAALVNYWRDHFLTIEGGFVSYLHSATMAIVGVYLNAFPLHKGGVALNVLLVVLGVAGVVAMARRSHLLPLAGAILASYLGLVALATVRIYPIGGGRTDIFLSPLSVVIACVGLVAVSRLFVALFRLVVGDGRWGRWARPVVMAIVQVSLLYPFVDQLDRRATGRRSLTYPKEGGASRYIRYINHQLRRDSSLVIHPMGRWAFGMYGRWAFDVEPDTTLKGWTTRYSTRLPIYFLPQVRPSRFPTAVEPVILALLQRRAGRIMIFGSHLWGRRYMLDTFKERLLQEGYRLRSIRQRKGAILWIFKRSSG